MADVTARGVRFHVQTLGERNGDLVVFLHGLVMDNLSSWYFTLANPASQIADVMLYDLRGHGRSERPPSGYGLADMVADLEALLDVVAPDRSVHLVGNSFGGLLALAFARTHRARTRSIVLVDAHLGDAGFSEQMAATLSLEGEERDRTIAESFKDWLGRHSERKRNRLAEAAQKLVRETTLVADMRATPAQDDLAIDVPILAIYGERSELRARGEIALARCPHVEVVVLDGCSHSVLWEATDAVRARTLEFLKKVVR